MHNVITEDSPEFDTIDSRVKKYRQRVNFDALAEDVRMIIADAQNGKVGYLTLEYPYAQVSNILSALRRRGLTHLTDYKLTRCTEESEEGEDGTEEKPEVVIFSPM